MQDLCLYMRFIIIHCDAANVRGMVLACFRSFRKGRTCGVSFSFGHAGGSEVLEAFIHRHDRLGLEASLLDTA